MKSSASRLPLLVVTILCATGAELFLKRGAAATPADAGPLHVLASGWTWVGIALYIGSFVSWLQLLRRMPLNLAYALMSVVQALVPLGCWYFLGEHIAPTRWLGISCVLAGVAVLAGPAMQAEERL
jgi:undecaprenyl phosphate-alpha-L-ara4N flippase subunit ArnF